MLPEIKWVLTSFHSKRISRSYRNVVTLLHVVGMFRTAQGRHFAPEREQCYSNDMSRDTAELLKEALALPADARAAIADSLLGSLDTEVDEDAEAAWQIEIERRVAELDSQVVSPVPWAEVRSRLMATLHNER